MWLSPSHPLYTPHLRARFAVHRTRAHSLQHWRRISLPTTVTTPQPPSSTSTAPCLQHAPTCSTCDLGRRIGTGGRRPIDAAGGRLQVPRHRVLQQALYQGRAQVLGRRADALAIVLAAKRFRCSGSTGSTSRTCRARTRTTGSPTRCPGWSTTQWPRLHCGFTSPRRPRCDLSPPPPAGRA